MLLRDPDEEVTRFIGALRSNMRDELLQANLLNRLTVILVDSASQLVVYDPQMGQQSVRNDLLSSRKQRNGSR